MPFSIQVCINGHEWLARQMSAKGVGYEQFENAFTFIENPTKAQQLADKLPSVKWEKILHVFARRVNPLLKTILNGMEYYWVIDQAEYATDIMTAKPSWLDELYIKWQKHAAVCFQAEDIMRFMGRKLHGSFNKKPGYYAPMRKRVAQNYDKRSKVYQYFSGNVSSNIA